MADSDEVMQAIGQLQGKMDLVITNQTQHSTKLDAMDKRIGKVETRAALNGAYTGGFVAVGISLLVAGAKEIFKGHGVS